MLHTLLSYIEGKGYFRPLIQLRLFDIHEKGKS